MFRRPMTAADEFDNEITDDTRIIFAFNPLTNRLKYHGPTRNPDVIIDFQSDCTQLTLLPKILILFQIWVHLCASPLTKESLSSCTSFVVLVLVSPSSTCSLF